jgi:hypothetical protein
MKVFSFRAGAAGLAILLLAGCSKPEQDTPSQGQVQLTPGQLVQTIIGMSGDMDRYGDSIDRHILTDQLAQTGPTALTPLLDYMQAVDTDPSARLFILQCVTIHLTPLYLPSIRPMVESEDPVIRAIGVTALGSIDDETVPPLLKQARNDPETRVAFSALSSLAMHGDLESREELKQLYLTGGTVGDIPVEQVNREIVRALTHDTQPEDLPVLMDALNQPYMEVNQRSAIARALGRMGDASAIPVLEQSVNLQNEPAYGELVQGVIAAIQAREDKA